MGELHKDADYPAFETGRWDAASHQQLWDWFSDPSSGGLETAARAWTEEIAGHFQAAADKVADALRAAGAVWEGGAAESMASGTTPLAEHAQVVKDAAVLAGDLTGRQAMDAQTLARTIPEPRPVPTQQELLDASGGNLIQYFRDVALHEAAANEAAERARDLVRSYDSGTDDAVARLPRFELAPAVVTGVVDASTPDVVDSADFGSVDPGDPRDAGDPRNREPGDPGNSGDPSQPGESPAPRPVDQPSDPGTQAPPGQPGATSGQSWTPTTTPPPVGPSPSPVVDGGRPVTQSPTLVVGGVPGAPGSTGHTPPRQDPRPPGGHPIPRTTGQKESRVTPLRPLLPDDRPRANLHAVAPPTAGRRDDEDTARKTPAYLVDHHDDFWDDTPPTAPPVIGDED